MAWLVMGLLVSIPAVYEGVMIMLDARDTGSKAGDAS